MCGLAGFVLTRATGLADGERVAAGMAAALGHRGPDDAGVWHDPEGHVGFGHCRLSVVDPSPAGRQPMRSRSGRYVLMFNGEIYNHLELRAALEAEKAVEGWRGRSDTETLLAAIDRWGLAETLGRCVGMFAIALWDRQERALTLARDRMGEKPLHYARSGDAFLFASELKALIAFPGFAPTIDPDALGLYLWFDCVPGPRSIYREARKLPAGTMLTLASDGSERLERYWSLDAVLAGPRFSGSPESAAEEVEMLLDASVRRQSVADVPVGAFLSGGIDSSAVVALMARAAPAKVRTFTVGFEDAGYDESGHAGAVARQLGTDHQAMIMTARDVLALAPDLARIWDEPFGDSSQVPTALLARMARGTVTVALTGDGGDELFCGYRRHRPALRDRLPAKRLLAALLRAAPLGAATPLGEGRGRLAHYLEGAGPAERYLSLLAQWGGEPGLAVGAAVTPLDLADLSRPPGLDRATYLSSIDARTSLVDDLLVKMDRAAMASSLETRAPMLDHRLVELAFSLPASVKLRNGKSKWPLRRLLEKFVPPALTDRPKQGFTMPIDGWLRGPLREWAGDLLSPTALAREGLIDPAPVARLWGDHEAGRANNGRRLWTVLMFQSWLDNRRRG